MKFIRKRVLNGEIVAGVYLNLGSSLTAEMAGLAGFDWVLIDLEHGSGDYDKMMHQLQAVEGTSAAPIIRIAWNEPTRFKRVLDAGASGVMVPFVSTVDEAKLAVASMQYPPQGIRGAAKLNRAAGFAQNFEQYFSTANEKLLTVLLIETAEAIKNIDDLAAVDGVDALYVGPLDLSISMGIPNQSDHPDLQAALDKVAAAARKSGKAAGTMSNPKMSPEQLVERGFTFLAIGSDGGLVANGMKKLVESVKELKNNYYE